MEIKNEIILKREFIKAFKKKYPFSHITPIESNMTAQGIPDLNISTSGEFWIEFKYGSNLLGPLQKSWITQHRLRNARVYVVRYVLNCGVFRFHLDNGNGRKFYQTLQEMIDDGNEW